MQREVLSSFVPINLRSSTDKAGRERTPLHSGSLRVTGALVLAVVCGAPSVALGESPARKDCTQDDVFERLTCKQGAIADQVEYTSDTVFADGTRLGQSISPAQLAHMKNAKARAQRAKRKNTKETFKKLAKVDALRNRKAGHLVPLDPLDADGICDYEMGDECAAIEVDASGNLQVCNPNKKNKGKRGSGGHPDLEGLECDLFYDPEEASTDSEAADMAEAAGHMEAAYSGMEDDLIEMNDLLDNVNALPDGLATSFTAAGGCVFPPQDPNLANAAFLLRLIKASTFGGARVSADSAGQTLVAFGFGGNARTLAIVFDFVALAADLAYLAVDEIQKREAGALQAAVMDCVIQTAGEIAALQDLMQQQHDEIRALLNTPHGQRPTWP